MIDCVAAAAVSAEDLVHAPVSMFADATPPVFLRHGVRAVVHVLGRGAADRIFDSAPESIVWKLAVAPPLIEVAGCAPTTCKSSSRPRQIAVGV